MGIDWTKPLEAVHVNGMITPVELDFGEENLPQPDSTGCYCIVDILDSGCGYGPEVFNSDGSAWIGDDLIWSAWTIRNRA